MQPYSLNDTIRRFRQRDTAFARAKRDPTCAAYGKPRDPRRTGEGVKPGYGQTDFALHAGSRALTGAAKRGGPPEVAGPNDRWELSDAGAMTATVKRAAQFYGAAAVGVTRVNPLWLYESDVEGKPIGVPDGLDTAIVLAVAMDHHLIRTSPSALAAAATGLGYSHMDAVMACLTRYLGELGWRAVASGNDTALSIPLAVDAGLGEVGRNGLLITPEFGPRVRLCKVLTDAPLMQDEPVAFGVEAFCQVCLKCARMCPSKSIPSGDKTYVGPTPSNCDGALKWHTNADRCLAFWHANGVGCCNCIMSCPFNKPPGLLHDWARGLARLRSSPIDRGLLLLDDWLGYGRPIDPSEAQ